MSDNITRDLFKQFMRDSREIREQRERAKDQWAERIRIARIAREQGRIMRSQKMVP